MSNLKKEFINGNREYYVNPFIDVLLSLLKEFIPVHCDFYCTDKKKLCYTTREMHDKRLVGIRPRVSFPQFKASRDKIVIHASWIRDFIFRPASEWKWSNPS